MLDRKDYIEKIMDESINEVYSQYESDHSMRCVIYVHPMFYNGTFSKNNDYQPEEPEILLTKDEFVEKFGGDTDTIWGRSIQTLFIYISKQQMCTDDSV